MPNSNTPKSVFVKPAISAEVDISHLVAATVQSTMFLSGLTVIDHAYVTPKGTIVGGSFLPSFLVTGEVTADESVVVDFSTVKKDIKALIDDNDHGLDHKLWIFPDSGGTLAANLGDRPGDYLYRSEYLEMYLPWDAVHVMPATVHTYSERAIGDYLSHWLTARLRQKYPSISVQCFNSTRPQTFDGREVCGMFTYTHGLKNSTARGCQNIAHGHLSFLQFFNPVGSAGPQHPLVRKIRADLDGTVFIKAENVVNRDLGQIEVSYTSNDRGVFTAIYDTGAHKVEVLETETTVELLAEYVHSKFGDDMRAAGITSFCISEGLTKGAFRAVDVPGRSAPADFTPLGEKLNVKGVTTGRWSAAEPATSNSPKH